MHMMRTSPCRRIARVVQASIPPLAFVAIRRSATHPPPRPTQPRNSTQTRTLFRHFRTSTPTSLTLTTPTNDTTIHTVGPSPQLSRAGPARRSRWRSSQGVARLALVRRTASIMQADVRHLRHNTAVATLAVVERRQLRRERIPLALVGGGCLPARRLPTPVEHRQLRRQHTVTIVHGSTVFLPLCVDDSWIRRNTWSCSY